MSMALCSSSYSIILPYGYSSPSSCFRVFLLLTIFCLTCVSSSQSPAIPYSTHCSSDVSESTPTARPRIHHSHFFPYIYAVRSYYHGGDTLFTTKLSAPSLTFKPIRNYVYRTEDPAVFKLKGYLRFKSSHVGHNSRRYGFYYGGNYSAPLQLSFLMNGYLNETSGRLCMVGSASWFSKQGKPVNLEAVLRLSIAKKNSTIFSSLVNGSLDSLSSSQDARYFEPIKIFAFTDVESYNYSLASEDVCKGGVMSPQNQSLSVAPGGFCSVFWRDYHNLGYSGGFMSLSVIQCSEEGKKVRFMLKFRKASSDVASGFNPNTTVVGEGSWDGSRNQLCMMGCRILNLNHVGDCSLRLSLRFPAVWTIRNNSRVVGELWTNKTSKDSGYFQMKSFGSTDHDMDGYYSLQGLNYAYTQTERARKLCVAAEVKGQKYPNGNSHDMRFDISILNSRGQSSWGNAVPIFVGDEPFETVYYVETTDISEPHNVAVEISDPEKANSTYSSSPMNMSYIISFYTFDDYNFTDASLNSRDQVEIIAEGIYHQESGHLCMVGCRKTQKSGKHSQDCEILVQFEFPSINSRERYFINGSIQSTRNKSDPLYFAPLNITSNAFYISQAKESIWRMDLEIIMVLISNTLACIFIVLQIFYVKSHPEMLPFISLIMLGILTLGHMIPLLLNFEALFLNVHQRRSVLSASGWVEVNEVIVRLVTMVAFLLQARLLQLAWTARLASGNDGKGIWMSEKKTMFLTFPLYLAGGLLTMLVKRMNGKNMASSEYSPYPHEYSNSTWGNLRSYAGFILDGFLFPQIILNIFHSSTRENYALSRWFYIGTTLVRLVPHAYDLYRVHNYFRMDVEDSYLYANPRADFYSTAWDIIIPCGGLVLAVIIWLQQRFGGRCILPQRWFRDSVVYEKVPNASATA